MVIKLCIFLFHFAPSPNRKTLRVQSSPNFRTSPKLKSDPKNRLPHNSTCPSSLYDLASLDLKVASKADLTLKPSQTKTKPSITLQPSTPEPMTSPTPNLTSNLTSPTNLTPKPKLSLTSKALTRSLTFDMSGLSTPAHDLTHVCTASSVEDYPPPPSSPTNLTPGVRQCSSPTKGGTFQLQRRSSESDLGTPPKGKLSV